jgi:hypothetical protein
VRNVVVLSNTSIYYANLGDTFNCSANGFPASSYSWSLNGVGGHVGNQYTVNAAGASSLTCQASITDNATTTPCSSLSSTVNIFVTGNHSANNQHRIS